MMLFVAMLLQADPMACLPTPSDAAKHGDAVASAYREAVAANDPKTPPFSSAPADARLLLRVLWNAAGNKKALEALRPLMDPQFTWSFGGDADADQAISEWARDPAFAKTLRAAVTGACKATKSDVTCAAKKGPRVVLEKKDGCWRWTAFVSGD